MTHLAPSSIADLRTLESEHELLEHRLEALKARKSHSPEERYEIQVIKKRKLALKDRIRELS